VRAVNGTEAIEPAGVRRYLKSKFGDDLGEVREAMQPIARSFQPEHLAEEAFRLYERFRPKIPPGEKGWGAIGVLDVAVIERLTKRTT
jgi:hypothetical protein